MTDPNTPSPDRQHEQLDAQEPDSGNRWEPASPPPPPVAAPFADPAPASGPYPVVGAPTAKRRRARNVAAATAAAVIAGFSGFAVGHVTAPGDDTVPASTQVGDEAGDGPGDHGRFGDGQPPSGELPGNGQAPDGVLPDRS